MIHRLLMLAASAGLSLALALPGAHAADQKSAAPMAIPAIISGTVTCHERIALPPGSEAIVQLLDTSRADAPAIVMAEQRIATAESAPLPYRLEYDAVTINPRNDYVVSAHIVNGETLLFTTDTAAPVITRGSSGHADLMLKKVSSPQK